MKPFTNIAICLLAAISLLHLLRLFFGWEIVINGNLLPVWVSAPGFIIAGGLALMLCKESHKN